MSPSLLSKTATPLGFPRVSGDEPVVAGLRSRLDLFSPRERG